MHGKKCSGGSWLYIAIDDNADLSTLNNEQKLYVGSQSQDRMFRGDGLKGKNFHHAERGMMNEILSVIFRVEKK